MIDWPGDLILCIARRLSVLYIGSGVSASSSSGTGAKPPTWDSFLRSGLIKVTSQESKQYIEKLLNERDMLTACEILIKKIGEHSFYELAQDAFRRPGFRPAEIHETIYKLDSRIVITPNVDKIYDRYATETSDSTVVIKIYTDPDIPVHIKNQDRMILKAHGTIDNPGEMIFSKRQYNEARYLYNAFYKILDALTLTHTYIFLGCGLSDPDIRLTLENYNFWFPGCRPNYFITAKESVNEDIITSLTDNCNLKLITYNNPDGNHQELLQSLNQLVELVEAKREELAATQNW